MILLGIVTDVNVSQFAKAPPAIKLIPSVIVYSPEKVSGINANTFALNTGDVMPEQKLNAYFPIYMTLLGIEIGDVRLEQPLNARLPICVTLFGITIELISEQL